MNHPSPHSQLFEDLRQTWVRAPMALYFAWSDTKARYRRSVLGPFWLVLGTGIAVIGLGVLWGTLLHQDLQHFIPSLTLGLIVWQWLLGCITEASVVLIRARSWVRNVPIPYLFFALQLSLKHLINFLHYTLVIAVVFLWYPPGWHVSQWLVVPGVLLVALHLLWMGMFLGVLGARFRDLDPMITALMPLLFFISPVLFKPEHLGGYAHLMWYNPLSYFITIIRDPLQGVYPPWWVYANTCVGLLVGWLLLGLLMQRVRHRVAFWV